MQRYLLTVCLVLLTACSDSGQGRGVAVEPETAEQTQARRVMETTERRWQDIGVKSDRELFSGLRIDTRHLVMLGDDGSVWARLWRGVRYEILVRETPFLTWRRASYRDAIALDRDFRFSDDEVIADYERQTLDYLERMIDLVDDRLIQGIHLYDTDAPSPEVGFPFMVEHGYNGQRNTLAYYGAFRPEGLELARADTQHVLEALEAGQPELPYESLVDEGFWREFSAHGGLLDDARGLAGLLAPDGILPLTNSEGLFDHISSVIAGDGRCSTGSPFIAWTDSLVELFAASPGDTVSLYYRPQDHCMGDREAMTEAYVQGVYPLGSSRLIQLNLTEFATRLRLYQGEGFLFGLHQQFDRFLPDFRFERQGDTGYYTTLDRYNRLVANDDPD